MIRRLYSLVFIRDTQKRKVLLGFKKRGFGKFKWNGLGGKVHPDESILDGAKRLVLKFIKFKNSNYMIDFKGGKRRSLC